MKYRIPKELPHTPMHVVREKQTAVINVIRNLSPEHVWSVEVIPYKKQRSKEQNAYLHAVPLRMICDETGYEMDDMKTYLLGEWSGWEEFEMMGSRRKRPCRRSSSLKTHEMNDFFEFIGRWASQHLGMVIPDPEGGNL